MLTTKQVCEILSCTPTRATVLLAQGKITGKQERIDGIKRNFYDEESIMAFKNFSYRKVCECGVVFFSKNGAQKHCNEACRRKHRKIKSKREAELPPRINPCPECGSIHCQPTEDSYEIYVVCLNCEKRSRGIKKLGSTCLSTEIKAIELWNRSN